MAKRPSTEDDDRHTEEREVKVTEMMVRAERLQRQHAGDRAAAALRKRAARQAKRKTKAR
jgi:hypothetical protein